MSKKQLENDELKPTKGYSTGGVVVALVFVFMAVHGAIFSRDATGFIVFGSVAFALFIRSLYPPFPRLSLRRGIQTVAGSFFSGFVIMGAVKKGIPTDIRELLTYAVLLAMCIPLLYFGFQPPSLKEELREQKAKSLLNGKDD